MAWEVGTSALSCVGCSILNSDCHFSKGIGICHMHREKGENLLLVKTRVLSLEIS